MYWTRTFKVSDPSGAISDYLVAMEPVNLSTILASIDVPTLSQTSPTLLLSCCAPIDEYPGFLAMTILS